MKGCLGLPCRLLPLSCARVCGSDNRVVPCVCLPALRAGTHELGHRDLVGKHGQDDSGECDDAQRLGRPAERLLNVLTLHAPCLHKRVRVRVQAARHGHHRLPTAGSATGAQRCTCTALLVATKIPVKILRSTTPSPLLSNWLRTACCTRVEVLQRAGEAQEGKRKSSKPPPKKVQPKLAKQFTCPFCNNEKTVTAKLDFENETGKVRCETCEASYETRITSLSDPIDVYSDWIDACEATKQAAAA